jgi:hypothetical protein
MGENMPGSVLKKQPRRKDATGPHIPVVTCTKMSKNTSKYQWGPKDLNGKSSSEQSKVLRAKLEEFFGDDRKNAALSLIEFAGNETSYTYKIASLIAVKDCGVDIGTVAQKILDTTKPFDESIDLLAKAGINLSDDAKDMLRTYCEKKSLDPNMHLIFI